MPTPSAPWSRRQFLLSAAAAGVSGWLLASRLAAAGPWGGWDEPADLLIVGGSLGGVAATLAACRRGCRVILTEETAWIGGQATTQAVPLDEHPWVETYGCTRSYRRFRQAVRDYYRRDYALSDEARRDPRLNPGAGWVSALCFEPRAGLAVLLESLAPYLSSGQLRLMTGHRPVAVETAGDRIAAVTVEDAAGQRRTLSAPYVLDATELGELLELGAVERVVGAEARAETGEPNALEGPADPTDQMAFTHVFALDHRPGEHHVIERPASYARWAAERDGKGKPKLEIPDLFGATKTYFGRPQTPNAYHTSVWNFRRLLCRDNFAPGTYPSDVTVAVWPQNEFHGGGLLGVPADLRRQRMREARELSLSVIYWLQTAGGLPGLRPRGDFLGTDDGLAQYPYIRESVRLRAEFTVLEQHFRADLPATRSGPMKYSDSVGVSGYRIDIHKPARGKAASMTEANHGLHWCQQIPLGALIPVRVENLLAAGKNLGVTAVTNGAFRVHPTEWNIGEAAGALAAFCVRQQVSPRAVRHQPNRLADFQRELVSDGFDLDWPSPRTARSYYSHHELELKDADRFYFGEASRLPA